MITPNPQRWEFTTWLSMFLGVFLLFGKLGQKSYWLDETLNLRIASFPLETMWSTLTSGEPYRWLYYIFLHYWIKLGSGESYTRILSALFATISLPLIYKLGKLIYGQQIGQIAIFLLAINAFFIRYGQEVHSYALVLTLSLLSVYYFLKFIKHPTFLNRGLYLISSLAAIYSHHFAGLIILSEYVSLWFLPKRYLGRHNFSRLLMLIILGTLPLIITPIPQNNLNWIDAFNLTKLIGYLSDLGGGHLVLGSIYLSLIGVAVRVFWFKPKLSLIGLSYWRKTFVFIWLIVPMAATILISLLFQPIFVSRYLLITLPPFLLLASQGLWLLKSRKARLVYLIFVSVFSGFSLYTWFTNNEFLEAKGFRFVQKENWRETARWVISQAKKSDAVIFYAYYTRIPFEYYFRSLTKGNNNQTPAIIELTEKPYPIGGIQPEPNQVTLNELTQKYPRVWLILSHNQAIQLNRPQQTQQIISALSARALTTNNYNFEAVQLVEFRYAD